MFNRRLLRAKALQSTYAYLTGLEAGKIQAMEDAVAPFFPNLNSMTPEDSPQLKGNREMAKVLIKEWMLLDSPPAEENLSADLKNAVWDAILLHRNNLKHDIQNFLRFAAKDFEAVEEMTLILLDILVLLQKESKELQQHAKKHLQLDFSVSRWSENPVIAAISASKSLQSRRVKSRIDHKALGSIPEKLWRERLLIDPLFQEYCQSNESLEAHKAEALRVLKEVILKFDLFLHFAEEHDLNWDFDKSIVRSLAALSIKEWQPEKEISLPELSPDWEEDRKFFEQLFTQTCQQSDMLDELISKKLKNWHIDRVNPTDEALIKLALTEMMIFPSIPIKVTINEYIELAKYYSTPKSKEFVNGLLDKLSVDMKADGLIKKSGRGLIDNK